MLKLGAVSLFAVSFSILASCGKKSNVLSQNLDTKTGSDVSKNALVLGKYSTESVTLDFKILEGLPRISLNLSWQDKDNSLHTENVLIAVSDVEKIFLSQQTAQAASEKVNGRGVESRFDAKSEAGERKVQFVTEGFVEKLNVRKTSGTFSFLETEPRILNIVVESKARKATFGGLVPTPFFDKTFEANESMKLVEEGILLEGLSSPICRLGNVSQVINLLKQGKAGEGDLKEFCIQKK
jgi:hypothetical protein